MSKIRSVGHGMQTANDYTQSSRLTILMQLYLRIRDSDLSDHAIHEFLLNEKFDVTLDDIAHLQILDDFRQDLHFGNQGIFMSALYAIVPEKVIVYESDVPIRALGYGLKDKMLINKGVTGNDFGLESYCTIINLGKTGYSFGNEHAGGLVINAGTVDSYGSGRFLVKEEEWVIKGRWYNDVYMGSNHWDGAVYDRQWHEKNTALCEEKGMLCDEIVACAREDPNRLVSFEKFMKELR